MAPSITAVAPPETTGASATAASGLAFVEVVATPVAGRSPTAEAATTRTVATDAPVTAFDRPEPRWSLWED